MAKTILFFDNGSFVIILNPTKEKWDEEQSAEIFMKKYGKNMSELEKEQFDQSLGLWDFEAFGGIFHTPELDN